MKLRVIHNFKFLTPGTRAMVLYPFILFRDKLGDVPEHIYKHELVHVRQINRMGFFSFYTSYLIYYLAGWIRFKDFSLAYLHHPYEKEARKFQVSPLTHEEREMLGIAEEWPMDRHGDI